MIVRFLVESLEEVVRLDMLRLLTKTLEDEVRMDMPRFLVERARRYDQTTNQSSASQGALGFCLLFPNVMLITGVLSPPRGLEG